MKPILKKSLGALALSIIYILIFNISKAKLSESEYVLLSFVFFILISVLLAAAFENIGLPKILSFLIAGFLLPKLIFPLFNFYHLENIFKINFFSFVNNALTGIIVLSGFILGNSLKLEKNFLSDKKVSFSFFLRLASLLFGAFLTSFILIFFIFNDNWLYQQNLFLLAALITTFISSGYDTIYVWHPQKIQLSKSKISFYLNLKEFFAIILTICLISFYLFFVDLSYVYKLKFFLAFPFGAFFYIVHKLVDKLKINSEYKFYATIAINLSLSLPLLSINAFLSFFIYGVIYSRITQKNIEKSKINFENFNSEIIYGSLFFLIGIYFTQLKYPQFLLMSGIYFLARFLWGYISDWITLKSFKINHEEPVSQAFLNVGALSIFVFLIYFENINSDLIYKDIFFSVLVINSIAGFIVSKIYFSTSKSTAENIIDQSREKTIETSADISIDKFKVIEPSFENESLNKAIYALKFKIKEIEYAFDKKILSKRIEQSFELAYEVSEIILEKFLELEKTLQKKIDNPKKLKKNVYELQDEIASIFLAILDSRKRIEKNIIEIEPLILEYFESFVKLTNQLPEIALVPIEKSLIEGKSTDTFFQKLWKTKVKIKAHIGKIISKSYEPIRKIYFREIAKYFLLGKISIELLETVNLIGLERIETLKKIKDLYCKANDYLNELLDLIEEEENSPALYQLLFEKLQLAKELLKNQIKTINDEIVDTSENIKTRLKYAIQSPYKEFVDSLLISGTIYFAKRKYRFSKIKRKSLKSIERSQESLKNWINYYIGAISLAEKEAILQKLRCDIALHTGEPLIDALDEIDEKLKSVCDSIEQTIKKYKKKFDEENANYGNLIVDLKNELLTNVIVKNLSKLEEIAKSKKINNLAESFLNIINRIIEKQTDALIVMDKTKLSAINQSPVYLPLKFISLRKVSNPILTIKLLRELSDISELLINHLSFTIEEMRNFKAIAEYRLNSSLEEFISAENYTIALAKENIFLSFEIFLEKADRLKNQIEKIEKNLSHKILESINESIEAINEQLEIETLKSSADKINITYLASKAKKAKLNFQAYISIYKEKSLKLFNSFLSFFKKIIIEKNRNSLDIVIEKDSYISPELDENKLKNLPYIYRRLFDGTPLENINIFAPNNETSKIAEELITNFKQNKSSSLLIVGEPGGGKRTIINSIASALSKDFKIYRKHLEDAIYSEDDFLNLISETLSLNKKLKFDELKTFLNDKTAKRIIILEGIQKLYLKKIGGYNALKIFLNLLLQTNKSSIWICSINKKAYDFLESNFEISNRFFKVINVEIFRSLDIKQVILNRHNATGFDLIFLPDKSDKLSGFFKKKIDPLKEQEKLQSEYFEKLEEYAEGNIIAAMYYWLKSIDKIQNNVIYIAPLKRITLPAIRNLDLLSNLTLAFILQQGWITVKEHSEAFNLTPQQSREILQNLANLNLILEDKFASNANKFFINKFFYKAIEKELSEKNII